MHDSAYRIGELVMRIYCDLPNARILEIGSLNVNGCLRDASAPTTHYVGLDLEEGPSVDFVMAPGDDFPVEDDSFDLVIASSVFEHDPRFWDTFLRMCRAARAGGYIYVNAPSNGSVHRYPMDNWRFYPDAGLALAEHARMAGMQIDLVESFIGNRKTDVWNDFVAVFRKGPCAEPLNTVFVYQQYPCLNARTWQSPAIIHNESEDTEDMATISALRDEVRTLMERLDDRERAAHDSDKQVAKMTDVISSLRSEMDGYHVEAAKAREKLGSLRAQQRQQASALRSLEDRIAQKDRDLSWFQRLHQLLMAGESGWVAYLPPRVRRQCVARSLQRHGVFDSDDYLNRNPDVAQEGMDPLKHYLLHGMREGRHLDGKS
jgi:hypothetical protein